MRAKRTAVGVAVALLVVPQAGLVAQDAALVDQVLAGHKSARQSIRTLSASIRVELVVPERRLLGAGTYWRIGDEVRVHQEGLGESTIDYRVKGGEVREVTLQGRPNTDSPGHALRTTEQDFTTRTNLFQNMLLVPTDPDSKPRDLGALLAAAVGGVAAKRQRLDGDQCVTLEFAVANRKGEATRYTMWHVPAKNYLIRRVEAFPNQAPTVKFVTEVTEWAEPAAGVVVPTSVKSDSFHKGKLDQSRVATVTDLRVNEPIAPAVMALPKLPRGSFMRDEVARVEGKVDSDWRPIGPTAPIRQVVALPQPAAGPASYTTQSSSEPVSAGYVILIASAGLLVLTLAVVAYRRYQTVDA